MFSKKLKCLWLADTNLENWPKDFKGILLGFSGERNRLRILAELGKFIFGANQAEGGGSGIRKILWPKKIFRFFFVNIKNMLTKNYFEKKIFTPLPVVVGVRKIL